MINVIFTIGCPGAGKTTWATKQVTTQKKTFMISLDDLRWLSKRTDGNDKTNDGLWHNLAYGLIRTYFNYGPIDTLIIDATNLKESHRKNFEHFISKVADEVNREFTIEHKVFDLNWVDLEKRNQKRGDKAVPISVLRTMYIKMQEYMETRKIYIPDTSKPKAIIVDIDGTLANNKQRSPYDLTQLHTDTVKEEVFNLIKMYKKDNHKILLVSGRHMGNKDDDNCYCTATHDWLRKNKIPYDALYMRRHNDTRKDDVVKEEIFWNRLASNYNIKVAIDDRNRVVEMWRRIGVKCLQVEFGEF